jgi:predicted Zn-dependent peptidase
MSRIPSRVHGALVAVLAILPAVLVAQAPTSAPAPGPVKPATLPAFQETTLPNGLRLMLVESHRQPVLSIALMLPAGDAYDPAGKEGLASAAASVLTKGAGPRTAEQVASTIEGVGGAIFAASGSDFLNVRASVLSANAPLAFELVGDAVLRPTFAQKEVDLALKQMASGLQLEQSNPTALAQRAFAAQLYGQHPYGRRPTPASVRSLTVDDLRAFQRGRLVPRGALLVIAGDIAMPRAKSLAAQYLGSWRGSPAADVSRPAPPARTRTEIVLVHRPGSVQSNILVGNLTMRPTDPRAYALTVAARILGGGTDGRLFKDLREKRSWTYGSYASLTRNRDIGSVVANAEVRNVVTDSALVQLLAIERDLGTVPISTTELEAGKGALVGSLPLQLETAQGIAEQVGRYTMLGLPTSYIRTLRPRLAAVTARDVRVTTHELIRPDAALIVVVGDGAQVYEKLAKIAPTRIVSAQGDAMQPGDLVVRTTVLPVDITKLAEHADSFAVMVQGNPMGWQTTSLRKTATGFAYATAMQVGPIMQQSSLTSFSSALAPVSVKASGKVQGQALSTDLVYAGGRVKGTSVTPAAGGPKTVAVDTTVAAGVLDDNMVSALVPGLPWAPNAKFTVSAFDASTSSVKQLAMNVTGTESVTVPAGTFQAYRVEMTGGPAPITMFVTATAPFRIIKMAPAGVPIEFLLVK